MKNYELEALKIKQLLDEGVLEMPSSLGINDSEISVKTKEILDVANTFCWEWKRCTSLGHRGIFCSCIKQNFNRKRNKECSCN